MFQAALDAEVPVRPVAIRLRLSDGRPGTAGAFIGEETLWSSLCRVLRLAGLVCELDLLPLLRPLPGEDRRALAARAEHAVRQANRTPAGRGVAAAPATAA